MNGLTVISKQSLLGLKPLYLKGIFYDKPEAVDALKPINACSGQNQPDYFGERS